MLSVEPKAEADNIYWDLDFPDNTKKESNNCLVILRFEKKKKEKDKKTTNTPSRGTEFDIALGNHALRAQARD